MTMGLFLWNYFRYRNSPKVIYQWSKLLLTVIFFMALAFLRLSINLNDIFYEVILSIIFMIIAATIVVLVMDKSERKYLNSLFMKRNA
jgi:hypothetical protein